jgi:hypothetical protein
MKNKPIFRYWFPNKNFLNDRKNRRKSSSYKKTRGREICKNLNGKPSEFKKFAFYGIVLRLLC